MEIKLDLLDILEIICNEYYLNKNNVDVSIEEDTWTIKEL